MGLGAVDLWVGKEIKTLNSGWVLGLQWEGSCFVMGLGAVDLWVGERNKKLNSGWVLGLRWEGSCFPCRVVKHKLLRSSQTQQPTPLLYSTVSLWNPLSQSRAELQQPKPATVAATGDEADFVDGFRRQFQ